MTRFLVLSFTLLVLSGCSMPFAGAAPEEQVSGEPLPVVTIGTGAAMEVGERAIVDYEALLTTQRIRINDVRMVVEVARTEEEQRKGLSRRMAVPKGSGMLFTYADERMRSFWMKDTLVPLDMLFFDAERTLTEVKADVPPCSADPCATYPSAAPAQYVLELAAGTAARLGIAPGATLFFE